MARGEHILKKPDDVVIEGEDDDGAILLQGSQGDVKDLNDTNLADGHAPKRHLMQEIESTGTDMGDGFVMQDVPVLVQRAADGSIMRTTPLNEIPGVSYGPRGLTLGGDYEIQKTSVTPAPISRKARHQMVHILAKRLFLYYQERQHALDGPYNPFRDGLPDLPAGSPEHLKPLPGTPLYPASNGQIMAWLVGFVGDRATVINKNQFGKDNLEDLALHIE